MTAVEHLLSTRDGDPCTEEDLEALAFIMGPPEVPWGEEDAAAEEPGLSEPPVCDSHGIVDVSGHDFAYLSP